jgi:hypothetical protein
MKKQFVMRGSTASSGEEVLNFTGHEPGMGYRLTDFRIYPTAMGTAAAECFASLTAGKSAADPVTVDFSDDGLIANALFSQGSNPATAGSHYQDHYAVFNDDFIITQNLILAVRDTDGANPVNWQCKFETVKLNPSEQAVTNFKQFTISDG